MRTVSPVLTDVMCSHNRGRYKEPGEYREPDSENPEGELVPRGLTIDSAFTTARDLVTGNRAGDSSGLLFSTTAS